MSRCTWNHQRRVLIERCEAQGILLSRRELDCLVLLLRGRSAQDIGRLLSISHKTAESYIQRAREKMQCQTRCDLFDKAYRIGMTDYVKQLIENEA